MKCWIAEQGLSEKPCNGALIRAHLIPKQRIKRELRDVARENVRERQRIAWRGHRAEVVSASALSAELDRLIWDLRVWVQVCGGPMGNAGHHGAVDSGGVGKIEIPRAKLPPELEEYAEQYGLEWSLEADYGPKNGE